MSGSSDDSDSEWVDNGLEGMDDDEVLPQQPATCLFCPHILPSADAAWQHCATGHGLDVVSLRRTYNLDCFDYIKMVNYCRKNGSSATDMLRMCSNSARPWSSDDYMMPVMESDALLTFDIEGVESVVCENGAVGVENASGDAPDFARCLTYGEQQELIARVSSTEQQAQVAAGTVQRLSRDVARMREAAAQMVLSGAADTGAATVPSVASLQEDEDEPYFSSYAHFSIHQDMLLDTVRTESYRDAFHLNRDLLAGRTVLDVGCGTAILSMFAARAGAARVVAIDMSDIAYQAMDIVRENGLDDRVTVVKGRVEDVHLPVEQVDVIVSEWMGYFLLFESMLDTVIFARDKWLAPGGHMLPDKCRILISGHADPELHHRHVTSWKDMYGFKMSCMQRAVVKEAAVIVVAADKVITDEAQVQVLDLTTCSLADLEFSQPFRLTAQRPGHLTAVVGYFDVAFSCLPNKVEFSTSPAATPTHWKQTVFLLPDPIPLQQGQVLEGQLSCAKQRKDPRALTITITLQDRPYTYHMQ